MKLAVTNSIVFCALIILAPNSHAQSAKDILDRAKNTPSPQQITTPKKQSEGIEPPILEDQIINNGNKAQQDMGYGTGTGFYINREGYLITAAHVVVKCLNSTLNVKGFDKKTLKAESLTIDTKNDLALLKVNNNNSHPLKLNLDTLLGEDAYTFGYPLDGELAQSGNFTAGIVTSLSGTKEDTSRFQISAPIQSGNSGGPVFDQKGNVLGVVLASRKQAQNEIIQNLNFALRSRLVEIFLSSNGIKTELSKEDDPVLNKVDIASRAQAASVLVSCYYPIPKKKEGEK